MKGALANVDGNLRYYDVNSGELYRNQFHEIDGSWYYFDGNGNAVKGMVTINGQNLLFDNNGKQIRLSQSIPQSKNNNYSDEEKQAFKERRTEGLLYFTKIKSYAFD